MAKPDAATLKDHVTDDPNGIGLSWSKDDIVLRDLLNQADYGDVQEERLDKGELLLQLTPAVQALESATDALQVKWDRRLANVRSVESVRLQRAEVKAQLDELVADELLAQSQRDAIGVRKGTYGEVVWGVDVTFATDDVRKARNA